MKNDKPKTKKNKDILPTYFVWKLVPKGREMKAKYIALIMAISVTALSVGSFYYKIYVIVNHQQTTCDQQQNIS